MTVGQRTICVVHWRRNNPSSPAQCVVITIIDIEHQQWLSPGWSSSVNHHWLSSTTVTIFVAIRVFQRHYQRYPFFILINYHCIVELSPTVLVPSHESPLNHSSTADRFRLRGSHGKGCAWRWCERVSFGHLSRGEQGLVIPLPPD